jgi:putative membrane protein
MLVCGRFGFQDKMMNRLCALLTSLWLGMQVMAGYIAAPILFERLGKQEAGNIAAVLFSINNYFGLLAWIVAWLVVRSERNRSLNNNGKVAPKFIILLLLLTASNQFLISPVIAAHKTGTANWLLSLLGGSFGMWHGISSIIYLVCSVLGLGLLWRYLKFENN